MGKEAAIVDMVLNNCVLRGKIQNEDKNMNKRGRDQDLGNSQVEKVMRNTK